MADAGHDKKKLWFAGPHDHHFIVVRFADKTVALVERERGLFTGTDGRVARAELAQRLPMFNLGCGFTGDILPVHLRARAL